MVVKNIEVVDEQTTDAPTMKAYIKGLSGGIAPATTETYGTVKQALRVVASAKQDAAPCSGDAPTKAEYDKLVELVNEIKHDQNATLTMLKTAGIMQD